MTYPYRRESQLNTTYNAAIHIQYSGRKFRAIIGGFCIYLIIRTIGIFCFVILSATTYTSSVWKGGIERLNHNKKGRTCLFLLFFFLNRTRGKLGIVSRNIRIRNHHCELHSEGHFEYFWIPKEFFFSFVVERARQF